MLLLTLWSTSENYLRNFRKFDFSILKITMHMMHSKPSNCCTTSHNCLFMTLRLNVLFITPPPSIFWYWSLWKELKFWYFNISCFNVVFYSIFLTIFENHTKHLNVSRNFFYNWCMLNCFIILRIYCMMVGEI